MAPAHAYVSVLTLGELRKGADALALRNPEGERGISLWIDRIEADYEDRVLEVNRDIARIWGKLSASRTRPVVDTLIAATAIHHGLTLVTRNVRDVQDIPVVLHDPWL